MTARAEPAGEVSALTLLNAVLRWRRAVALCGLLGALAFALPPLLRSRTYSSSATFVPQSRKSPGGISGLAAQLGLAGLSGDGAQTPAFYAELIKSRQVLADAVTTTFAPSDSTPGQTLVEIYKARGDEAALREDRAIERLNRDVDVSVGQKTAVVRVTVHAKNAVLAQRINQRLLDLLNKFNLETRQSQASAERRFTEHRLAEVKAELRAAEDQLARFVQRNRAYQATSDLNYEKNRLERELGLQQQIYNTVAQSYEQAKIDEVRDTPVITVVEPPTLAVRPDSRNLFGLLLLGTLLGVALAIAAAVLGSVLRDTRSDPDEAREFAALRSATAADVNRLLRRRPGPGVGGHQ